MASAVSGQFSNVAWSELPPGLFVTGTDTNVGKTHVACLIGRQLTAAGRKVGVYKPVCSGAVIAGDTEPHWNDVEQLRAAVGANCADDLICPQRFREPVAPPLAARREGRQIDESLLAAGATRWKSRCDFLIVEGAGGFLSPVSESGTVADVAVALRFPLLIVARCGLGTINQTLLTIEAARNRELSVAGVILNQSHPDDGDWGEVPKRGSLSLIVDNVHEIERRSGIPVLGVLSWNATDLQRPTTPVTIPVPSIPIDWVALSKGCEPAR